MASSVPTTTGEPAILLDAKKALETEFVIFAGSASLELGKAIASKIGVPLGQVELAHFSDGETRLQVKENVRGKSVYIIQSTSRPVNDNLVQLCAFIQALKLASAAKVTAVVPYYGYARSDRKVESRVPLMATLVASMLETAGVDHLVCLDLHATQIQGFFKRAPVDNLEAFQVVVPYFLSLGLDPAQTVVVSPDAGGVTRASHFQDALAENGFSTGFAIAIKQRSGPGQIKSMNLVGNVNGLDIIIVDDICDTFGTASKCISELRSLGARRIFMFVTHGLFSGNAMKLLHDSPIEKIVVTDSVTLDIDVQSCDKIVQVSAAHLLAAAISRIHLHQSVSELFLAQDKKMNR